MVLQRVTDNSVILGQLDSSVKSPSQNLAHSVTSAALAASLDKNVPSSIIEAKNGSISAVSEWSRQQKRGYQRVMSLLRYWEFNGFQVLWIMLSSSADSDVAGLSYHHQLLRLQAARRFKFEDIQHFQVRTSEGHGVLHVLWAWKPKAGFQARRFFIGQRWLSEQWLRLHGAEVVWINKVDFSRHGSSKRISRYCVSQYCGEQAQYEYMSWSWRRAFGFPMVAAWRWLKRVHGGYYFQRASVAAWRSLMSGEKVAVFLRQSWSEVWLSLEVLRKLYCEYGSMLWEFQ